MPATPACESCLHVGRHTYRCTASVEFSVPARDGLPARNLCGPHADSYDPTLAHRGYCAMIGRPRQQEAAAA